MLRRLGISITGMEAFRFSAQGIGISGGLGEAPSPLPRQSHPGPVSPGAEALFTVLEFQSGLQSELNELKLQL